MQRPFLKLLRSSAQVCLSCKSRKIKHTFFNHKKTTHKNGMNLFPGLPKIYQVAWWQSTFLSLSDITSHYLLLCYYSIGSSKRALSLLFLFWLQKSSYYAVPGLGKAFSIYKTQYFKFGRREGDLQDSVRMLYVCIYLIPAVYKLKSTIQNSTRFFLCLTNIDVRMVWQNSPPSCLMQLIGIHTSLTIHM